MSFFDTLNDKFFNPFCCRNRAVYFECIYRENHIGLDRSVETGEFSGETGKQILSGAC